MVSSLFHFVFGRLCLRFVVDGTVLYCDLFVYRWILGLFYFTNLCFYLGFISGFLVGYFEINLNVFFWWKSVYCSELVLFTSFLLVSAVTN